MMGCSNRNVLSKGFRILEEEFDVESFCVGLYIQLEHNLLFLCLRLGSVSSSYIQFRFTNFCQERANQKCSVPFLTNAA